MVQRPIIKIINTKFDVAIIVTTYILLFILCVATVVIFYKAPDIIPTHFNIEGKIDSYGNKATLFILPLITLGVTLLLQWLCKYPHLFNYPQHINENNAATLYQQGIRLLRWVNVGIIVLMLFLQYEICNSIHATTSQLSTGVFIVLLLCTTLLPIIVAYIMSNKKLN
ncbi:DUF1648 domain-containing protein [Ferruginibacter yonginensis]|uniref:DUF1648 domain-containing protein n=1 Tax=Ferruginibacter yonginensis TaxID=1310416 RepID=A0ABV8QND5_9BACT